MNRVAYCRKACILAESQPVSRSRLQAFAITRTLTFTFKDTHIPVIKPITSSPVGQSNVLRLVDLPDRFAVCEVVYLSYSSL